MSTFELESYNVSDELKDLLTLDVTPPGDDVQVPETPVLLNDRRRYSVSKLKMWMNCSLQAFYRYEMRLDKPQSGASSFGTIIHAALQRYNEGSSYEEAVEFFEWAWKNPHELGLEPQIWHRSTSYGSYRKIGLDVLAKFNAALTWENREVLGTEVGFVVPFGRHELHGYIDLLEIRKNKRGLPLLRIIDYKTGYKLPTIAELALDIQFTGYAWAVRQEEFWVGNGSPEFPGIEGGADLYDRIMSMGHRGIWYHLRNGNEKDVGERDEHDFERMYRVMDTVWQAQEAGIYMPKIGEACGLCDYREECELEIPSGLGAVDPDDPHAW